MFNPDLKPGDIISNRQLMSIFHCACEGGIRYSSKTSTIVLVVNNTRQGLPNRWANGILHFAGRVIRDGDKLQGPNLRLNTVLHDKGAVFLFEVNRQGQYTYRGSVKLAGEPVLAETESGLKYPLFPLLLVDASD